MVLCLTFGYLTDIVRHRYGFIMLGVSVGTVGYVILLNQKGLHLGVKYFAIFTLVSSGSIVQPLVLAWAMNNVAGSYKRAFASAAITGFGNIGGIVASVIVSHLLAKMRVRSWEL